MNIKKITDECAKITKEMSFFFYYLSLAIGTFLFLPIIIPIGVATLIKRRMKKD